MDAVQQLDSINSFTIFIILLKIDLDKAVRLWTLYHIPERQEDDQIIYKYGIYL